ncbi:MAG: UPF0175 family protein [Blastocatellia bacterium]
MQQAILTIPDGVAAAIQNGSSEPLEQRLLELSAIQAHESDLITEREVMEMLGFEDREDLNAFFKRYDVRSKYTTEDFEREGAALDALLARNGK